MANAMEAVGQHGHPHCRRAGGAAESERDNVVELKAALARLSEAALPKLCELDRNHENGAALGVFRPSQNGGNQRASTTSLPRVTQGPRNSRSCLSTKP